MNRLAKQDRIWTDADVREAGEVYATLGTYGAVAARYGIPVIFVRTMLVYGKRHGLVTADIRRGRKPGTIGTAKWSPDALRRLSREYQDYKSLEAVAERYGLTKERVRQLLTKGRKLGLCAYSPRWKQCEAVQHLHALVADSASVKELASKAGYAAGESMARLLRQTGSTHAVKASLAGNRLRRAMGDLIRHADRLSTPTINTSIVFHDHAARAAYCRVQRCGGYRTAKEIRWAVQQFRQESTMPATSLKVAP